MKALAAVLALALTGCTTGTMRRDLDVSGELPRVIGLGAFSPSCLMLCFVTNNTTQGDANNQDEVKAEHATINVKEQSEGSLKVKPKSKISAKEKPP